jgi:WD40 repeat protein/tRNA A-37 threonylcarbamoyl transferase component Bud32
MGVVYRARDTKLKRDVALKMILADGRYLSSRAVDRFRLEAEAVARLKHPNILEIFDAGECEGQHYFTMELVGGGSLADQMGRLVGAPREAARLVALAARAVHHAHLHGILHRDLKPGNILLTPGGEPKIADFGLARHAETDTRLTQSGAVLGTPAYMAPEQAEGRKDLSVAADVYALGAILYEGLTGRLPFPGDTPAEILKQLLKPEAEPIPPRRLKRTVPRDLETICLKCLERQPSRRYKSAEAVAEDLCHFLNDEPIGARPVSRLERAAKWVRRRPALAGLYAALVLVFVFGGGGGFATWMYFRAEEFRGEAQRLNSLLQMKDGATLCEQGETGRDVLLMAQGLENCPDSAPDLRRAIRTALASAATRLHALEAAFPSPAPTIVTAISPDGRHALLGGRDTFLVDLDSGERRFVQVSLDHNEISGAAFSPDNGRLFATSTMRSGKDKKGGGVVRVGDTATGKDVGPAIIHPGTVKSIAFSPDGKTLLVGAQAGTSLRCYDLATRRPVPPAWDCHDTVYVAVYGPDARLVATAAQENNARLWDARTGRAVGPPMVHPGVVFTVAFSPDGNKLVTGCRDGAARFWDVATGNPAGPVLRHHGPVRSAAFSRDGRLVLTASEDGTARLWEAETGYLVGQVLPHPDEVRQALFATDRKHVLTAGFEGTARLWRLADEQASVKEMKCPGAVAVVALSPDGRRVLTGCEDSEGRLGESRLWDAETGEPLGEPMPQSDGRKGQVMSGAFSPDGKLVLTGGNNGEVRLWHTATSARAQNPWPQGNIVAAIAFSPDGSLAAASGLNGIVEVRDVATGKIRNRWRADSDGFWVWSLAFTDDETLLTGGGLAAKLWRWRDGEVTGQPMRHETEAHTAVLSPDRQIVLTCGHDKNARLWSARDGQPLSEWMVHKGEVLAGAFRPDGKVAATAAADGTLRLWEVPTGEPLIPPLLHDGWVRSVAFSPDGKTVVTGCDDGTARLWGAENGAPLGAVLRHRGPVNRVVFSPDGKRVLTGSKDRTARLWTPPPPVPGDPALVTLWAQVLTGMELDKDGTAQVLPREEWLKRRLRFQELGGLPGTNP